MSISAGTLPHPQADQTTKVSNDLSPGNADRIRQAVKAAEAKGKISPETAERYGKDWRGLLEALQNPTILEQYVAPVEQGLRLGK